MPSISSIRSQFPILKRRIHGKPLVYLDNAATTQKPKAVIDVIGQYYRKYNANVHRAVYTLSEEATAAYEESRATIARWIEASPAEVIITRNTTESINMVARGFVEPRLKSGQEILATQLEHHSNLVPWQQLACRAGAQLRILPITDEGRIDVDSLPRYLTNRTAVLAVTHCSNVLGTILPVRQLIRVAHAVGAWVVVDGAQAVAHMRVDMKNLDADFYTFSSHKMYGPTGVGILYGKEEHLARMEPLLYGGDMVKAVEWFDAQWNEVPWRFEAGTPNVAGVIGAAEAVRWMNSLDGDALEHHERDLTAALLEGLGTMKDCTIYGPHTTAQRIGVVSLTLKGIHPHDLATLVDREGVAIRSGHHCAMPLMTRLGVAATARASLAAYNTKQDIAQLLKAIQKAQRILTPPVVTPVLIEKRNLWQR